jgi:hypothetical protein
MHKEFFFVNYNTLLHVSTLLGHLQGETFRCRYTSFHYTVKRVCAVGCALRRLWRRELFVVSACTAQCTVNSTFLLNCIVQPSVTTTESFSLKMTQQGRNMQQCVIIDEKNSLCIRWCLNFFYIYYSARTWNTLNRSIAENSPRTSIFLL